ncbi:MAG: STY0301 family protein [Burkholderiaceae bacterium]
MAPPFDTRSPPRLLACACAIALALAACVAHGATPPATPSSATDLHCPATLAQMPVADNMPQGWVVHGTPREQRLQRATFYDGDPVGLGTLVPDATHRAGLTETSTWLFGTGDSAHVWIGCFYRDASAVVARPLPGGLHQCTTVTRLTALGDPSEPLSVQCR